MQKLTKLDFLGLVSSLDTLAADNIIKDKRYLLKNKIFTEYKEEELIKFIDRAKEYKKDQAATFNYLNEKVMFARDLLTSDDDYVKLSTAEIIKIAKQVENNYKDLYNLIFCYQHNCSLALIRGSNKKEDTLEEYQRWQPIAAKLKEKYADFNILY